MRSSRPLLSAAFLLGVLAAAPASEAATTSIAVGPQYDSTHVYVAPQDFDRFIASFVATFGGTASKQGVLTVTPTPSQTISQIALTPAGSVSVFGFKTPVPYPFGLERTGYLVTNLDEAVKEARAAGADVIVAPFPDPVGRDAIVQWPGGVNMQLYWHTVAPSYAPLATVPENRVYVSADRADLFVHDFLSFAQGRVVSDVTDAPGVEIGRSGETYRRVRLQTAFGKLTVLVTDGHLPYPYGRELTGYQVPDLAATLTKAQAAGAEILIRPCRADHRQAAFVRFPGGYIAEIHSNDAAPAQ